jgi:hypothetical protein
MKLILQKTTRAHSLKFGMRNREYNLKKRRKPERFDENPQGIKDSDKARLKIRRPIPPPSRITW